MYDPIPCEAQVYQVIDGEMRKLDFDTGNYGADILQPINGNPDPFTALNGLGYNETDGYMYAVVKKKKVKDIIEIPEKTLDKDVSQWMGRRSWTFEKIIKR